MRLESIIIDCKEWNLTMAHRKKAVYFAKLGLVLIVVFTLVCFLPITSKAQDATIDLVLSGEGATSWQASNIKPGESGTSTTTLHNAGYRDGTVNIWISDVVNTEGANPESETGNTAEPGDLGTNLLFNISSSRLTTNIGLPAKIDNMPQSVSGSNYLKIDQLNSGETLVVEWQWKLPTETGNDVQSDSLSFSINYCLEELIGQDGESDNSGSPSDQMLPTPIPTPNHIPTPTPTDTPIAEPPLTTTPPPVTSAGPSPTPDIPTAGASWPLIVGGVGGVMAVALLVYFLKKKRAR